MWVSVMTHALFLWESVSEMTYKVWNVWFIIGSGQSLNILRDIFFTLLTSPDCIRDVVPDGGKISGNAPPIQSVRPSMS